MTKRGPIQIAWGIPKPLHPLIIIFNPPQKELVHSHKFPHFPSESGLRESSTPSWAGRA